MECHLPKNLGAGRFGGSKQQYVVQVHIVELPDNIG